MTQFKQVGTAWVYPNMQLTAGAMLALYWLVGGFR